MFKTEQVLLLVAVLFVLHVEQIYAQGFFATYNSPLQNSFAFATPNLKQVFTTKLTSGPQIQQFSQQLQDQQVYNIPQQNFYSNFPQQYQQQQAVNGPINFFPGKSAALFQTTPQQFSQQDDQYLRQQSIYQQQQQQYVDQFQPPFVPSQRDIVPDVQFEKQISQDQQRDDTRIKNLLGVAYSPSTQVSQVKFDNGKLKYDF